MLLGKYRVERLLGEGSMGTIFAARHVESGELFALKVLTAKALASSQAMERFLREARALARLRGPHVVKVHEIARLTAGAPCMVMEYLHGADLQEILKTRGLPPIREALEWMIQACEGVAEAHALDIVHRDIKPANLFVSREPDGRTQVRMLDFGIAKLVERDGPFDQELTQVGMVFGTPAYMSPEQHRQTKDVDARTDIWSLGVVLYELLTGVVPFSPANGPMDLALRISVDTPARPGELRPGVPPALDALVLKCLEKKPERRFQTVPELAGALLSIAATVPLEERGLPPSVPPAPISAPEANASGTIILVAPASRRSTPAAPPSAKARAFPVWKVLAAATGVGIAIAAGIVFLWPRSPVAAHGAPSHSAPLEPAPSTTAAAPPAAPSASAADSTPSPSAAAPSSEPSASSAPTTSTAARPPPIRRGTPWPKCTTAADCKKGRRCLKGYCR